MARSKAHRGLDDELYRVGIGDWGFGIWGGEIRDSRFGIGQHGDPADGDRREVPLRSPDPVFVRNIDRVDVKAGSEGRACRLACLRRREEEAQAVAALLGGGGREVVDCG